MCAQRQTHHAPLQLVLKLAVHGKRDGRAGALSVLLVEPLFNVVEEAEGDAPLALFVGQTQVHDAVVDQVMEHMAVVHDAGPPVPKLDFAQQYAGDGGEVPRPDTHVYTQTHGHTETDTQTETETDKERERERQTETETETENNKNKNNHQTANNPPPETKAKNKQHRTGEQKGSQGGGRGGHSQGGRLRLCAAAVTAARGGADA